MSDFAKTQLLKYGWTEGKGLGKNENGIVEALKPKLKFNKYGIGHSNVDFQWWESVYNKSLKNIILDKNSDEIFINLEKKDAFDISSSKSYFEPSKQLLYYGKFLKTSTLQNENMIRDNTSEIIKKDSKSNPIIVTMSNEDLFKACNGRTTHKAARHGLTLCGKLSRITKQEKQLHAIEFLKSNNKDPLIGEVNKMKKKEENKFTKKKTCTLKFKDKSILDNNSLLVSSSVHNEHDHNLSKKTRKKVKRKIQDLTYHLTKSCIIQDNSIETKKKVNIEIIKKTKNKSKKKSKQKKEQTATDNHIIEQQLDENTVIEPHNKKLKNNYTDFSESIFSLQKNNQSLNYVQSIDYLELIKNKNKYKKDKNHKYNYCSNTEAQRLNAKIKSKKIRKQKKEERKKFKKLSESLLAVNLNVNSNEENINRLLSNK